MSLWRVRLARVLLVFAPLVLGGLLLFASKGAKTPPARIQAGKPATRVRIVTLEEVEVVPRVRGYGVAVPERVFRAVARVEGDIAWIADALEDGQIVSKGDALLRIDDTGLKLELARIDAEISAAGVKSETLEASLEIEEADLAFARTDLTRLRDAARKGAVAGTAVDEEERQVLASRGKVQTLRNLLALAEAERKVLVAQRRQTERLLSFVSIAAPFDMRIGEVAVEVGQFVSRGQDVFSGDGLAAAEIPARFPIGRLRPLVSGGADEKGRGPMNLEAVVRLRTLDRVIEWPATVDRVGPGVDPRTQSAIIVVRVAGSYQTASPGERPPIRRNTFLEVELRARPRSALVVPAEAVRGGRLFVIDAANRLEIRTARIAYRIGSTAVISAGAGAGDRVVVSDLPAPVPGMVLDPVEDLKLMRHVLDEAAGRESVK